MPVTSVAELIPVLQVAIGPVILISGVGLLLLTMTNRYGRVIDRSRLLIRELSERADTGQEHVRAELGILMRRAELIRLAILLAGISVLLAASLIIVLFFVAPYPYECCCNKKLRFRIGDQDELNGIHSKEKKANETHQDG